VFKIFALLFTVRIDTVLLLVDITDDRTVALDFMLDFIDVASIFSLLFKVKVNFVLFAKPKCIFA
jgi:hypothetical protein